MLKNLYTVRPWRPPCPVKICPSTPLGICAYVFSEEKPFFLIILEIRKPNKVILGEEGIAGDNRVEGARGM